MRGVPYIVGLVGLAACSPQAPAVVDFEPSVIGPQSFDALPLEFSASFESEEPFDFVPQLDRAQASLPPALLLVPQSGTIEVGRGSTTLGGHLDIGDPPREDLDVVVSLAWVWHRADRPADRAVDLFSAPSRIRVQLSCDFDIDGAPSVACGGTDCDDEDSAVRPGLTEVCDEVDRNCDGAPHPVIDDDGDGIDVCDDCQDLIPDIHPGAPEVCDGIDNDCDPTTSAPGGELDADGDSAFACADCDDGRTDVHPGAVEACDGVDTDCDGAADFGGVPELDFDGDGAWSCEDCDDSSAAARPGLQEVCDGVDNDCDGAANADVFLEVDGDGDGARSCEDCDDADAARSPALPEACDGVDNDCSGAPDLDVAGEADADGASVLSCDDCDDADPTAWPGAAEQCDGIDTDCDGSAAGEGDVDGDGAFACDDCDDSDPARAPGFPEACDGLDNDCSGAPDADAAGEVDADGDGFLSCADCADSDPAVHPAAVEQCDGVDSDCSDAPAAPADELDSDGDGYLACAECANSLANVFPGAPELCNGLDDDCDGIAGVAPGDEDDLDGDGSPACDDCDDGDPARHPAAADICDLIDNDCDGVVDSGWTRIPDDEPDLASWLQSAAPGFRGCLSPGTYAVPPTLLAGAGELVGASGSAATTLQGSGDSLLAAESFSGVLVIEGFTLQGVAPTDPDWWYGDPTGAIDCQDGSLELRDVRITDCEGPEVTAISAIQCDLHLEDVEVDGNVGGSGPLIRHYLGTADVQGLHVHNNLGDAATGVVSVAFDGTAVALQNVRYIENFGAVAGLSLEGSVVAEYVAVLDNHGPESWGTVTAGSGSHLDADYIVIAGNTASTGAGLLVSSPASAFLDHAVIYGNHATQDGGAVKVFGGGALTLSHAIVAGNASNSGDSFDAGNGGIVNMTDVTFWANGPSPYDPPSLGPDGLGTDGVWEQDPLLVQPAAATPAQRDFHLQVGSPLIDAATGASFDPDGSLGDIGAYGGLGADGWDLDGDGSPSWWTPGPYTPASAAAGFDCDDLDSGIQPGSGC